MNCFNKVFLCTAYAICMLLYKYFVDILVDRVRDGVPLNKCSRAGLEGTSRVRGGTESLAC